MQSVDFSHLARNEADIIIKNITKNFLIHRKTTGAELPDLTNDQLNKIFTVALKPKELNEKHTLIQLFRCFRGKKKVSTLEASHHRQATVDHSIENSVIQPLKSLSPRKPIDKTGLESLSINPIASSMVRRDLLWLKYPKRPVTKTKARFNIHENKQHRSFLNKSDLS